jgi:hypothetical protein
VAEFKQKSWVDQDAAEYVFFPLEFKPYRSVCIKMQVARVILVVVMVSSSFLVLACSFSFLPTCRSQQDYFHHSQVDRNLVYALLQGTCHGARRF